jgi:hypothetical protein
MTELFLNPRSDRVFVDHANQLVRDGKHSPTALESALRARYPAAAVRPSQVSSGPNGIWYIYRDGRWVDG